MQDKQDLTISKLDKDKDIDLEIAMAQAYIVIGDLLHRLDEMQTSEGQRVLDYFADGVVDDDFLPWPRS